MKRIDLGNNIIETRNKRPDEEEKVSYWLRFQKDFEVEDEDHTTKQCQVAIAYGLEPRAPEAKQGAKFREGVKRFKVVPVDGEVSIFFPAAKESSGLKFHIHAPFASTVARDSIRECEPNEVLRDALADLAVESLHIIKERGLLTVDFLAVLPNQDDYLEDFYDPIFDAVVDAFNKNPLTPTKCGTFHPASLLYRAPVKVTKLIPHEDLVVLTGDDDVRWAANPNQLNSREDKFMKSLEVVEWQIIHFVRELCDLASGRIGGWQSWISDKDSQWFKQLYSLLDEVFDKRFMNNRSAYYSWGMEYKCFDALRNASFVRVETSDGYTHVRANEAFFSAQANLPVEGDVYFVSQDVYHASRGDNCASLSFLKKLGVRIFDTTALVEKKLDRFIQDSNEIPDEQYYEDLRLFVSYWKSSKESDLFKEKPILYSEREKWECSEKIVLDLPYKETGLSALYWDTLVRLNDCYEERFSGSSLVDFVEFVTAIGVCASVRITKLNSIQANPNVGELCYGWGNARRTSSEIKEDYRIDGLDDILEELKEYPQYDVGAEELVIDEEQKVLPGYDDTYVNLTTLKRIWEAVINAETYMATAKYGPNESRGYKTADSTFVDQLRNNAWIPDRNGRLRKPCDMTEDDLRDDFTFRDTELVRWHLRFGAEERRRKLESKLSQREKEQERSLKNKVLSELGAESEEVAREGMELRRHLEETGELEKVRRDMRSKNSLSKPQFPSSSVPNPERREAKLLEQFSESPDKSYEKRERSVRTTQLSSQERDALLARYYTNDDDQLICQICHDEMPFKKRNGDYYFEAVEALPKKHLPKEHEAQCLALCPVCAARYKEFVIRDAEACEKLVELVIASSAPEVRVILGDLQANIRFVEKHFHDIQTILSTSVGELVGA